jgi:hypothetical protein
MKRGIFLRLLIVSVAGMAAGAASAVEDTTKPTNKKKAKHDCAGKNTCKGKGGCKGGDNGCSGKNSCQGKGGCAVPVRGGSKPGDDCGPDCCVLRKPPPASKDSKDNKDDKQKK